MKSSCRGAGKTAPRCCVKRRAAAGRDMSLTELRLDDPSALVIALEGPLSLSGRFDAVGRRAAVHAQLGISVTTMAELGNSKVSR